MKTSHFPLAQRQGFPPGTANPGVNPFEKRILNSGNPVSNLLERNAFADAILHEGPGILGVCHLPNIGSAISKKPVAACDEHLPSICEDCGFAAKLENGATLLGVFDGMGGPGYGGMVSRLCMGVAMRHLVENPESGLFQAFRAAEKALKQTPEWLGADPDKKPGCTLCLARIEPSGEYSILQIGDCRAYSVDASDSPKANLITADQNLVINSTSLVLKSMPDSIENLSPAQKDAYVNFRNLVGHFLGESAARFTANCYRGALKPNEHLVLASDGVGDVMTKKDVAGAFSMPAGPSSAAQKIIELACGRCAPVDYENPYGQTVFGKPDDAISIVFRMP